jgi:hypothetical protein
MWEIEGKNMKKRLDQEGEQAIKREAEQIDNGEESG